MEDFTSEHEHGGGHQHEYKHEGEHKRDSNPKKDKSRRAKMDLKLSRKQLYFITVALFVLVLILAGVLIYKKGFSDGENKASKNSPFNLNNSLLDNRNGNPLSVQTVSGKIVKISDTEITVERSNKESKTFSIGDNTVVTQKGDNKEVSDLAKDMTVTIFAQDKSEDSPAASRIVIR